MLNNFQDEIIKLLKKKKKEKLEKLGYDDVEKLIRFYNSGNISKNLKHFIGLLRKAHYELNTFLEEEWEKNVVKEQRFDGKESRFYRVPVDSSYYKNFLFFNYSKGNLEQKNSFYDMLSFNLDTQDMLTKIDKTVNKFLPSEEEFLNVNYTKFSPEEFQKQFEYLFVYLLCFIYAFESYKNMGNVCFYSNDLGFSHGVNKSLKVYKDKIGNYKNRNTIFRLTWQQIINSLVEYKSYWSLENMYIIFYRRLDNQTQEDVQYIGIPKLQASLIIDDTIREYLNKSIPTLKEKNKKTIWVWLLEEFVKGKSLLPYVINYLHGLISEKWKGNGKSISNYTLLNSLAIDAEIKKMKSNVYEKKVFGTEFFTTYKNVVNNVKSTISTMYSSQKAVQDVIEKDDKKQIATSLFNYVRGGNKYGFVNLLLKHMIGETGKFGNEKDLLVNYLFNNILSNEICWENYALPIIIGLIKGGEKYGE